MDNKQVIISGVKLDLTDSIKSIVTEKVERLFRHEEKIIRILVELQHDQRKSRKDEFIAKGHIEISGPPMVVSAGTDDLYKSIDEMVDKLDRKIRRRSRLDRVKRKAVHSVDIPAHIPKVAEA